MAFPTERGWLGPALLIVGAITGLRWLLLAFDATDLYVDEAQYWLWGQEFAFGYYSKPPLIGWLIGAVTALAGSDAVFWVRMPGAALHGATALILAALAARMLGARAAVLVAAGYVTLPMAALGSLLISTDTVMAPFFAAALYFQHRLAETRARRFAVATGVMIGLAFLAKYAAIYFLIGLALAALLRRDRAMGWGNALSLLAAFGVVIAPNLLWNLSNQLTTFSHTADNIGWVRQTNPLAGLNLSGLLVFLASQFAVVGPVIFAALLAGLARPGPARGLWPFILPPLAVVSVQALLGDAQANWAVAAYFAGTILAVSLLLARPVWLWLSFAINGAISLIGPFLVIFTGLSLDGETPLLDRQLGRAAMSRQIIALAEAHGNLPIHATRRDILADLLYTGKDAGLTVYAPRRADRPRNHYEQRYPLPMDLTGPVLMVAKTAPACPVPPAPIALEAQGGAYAKWGLAAFIVDAGCLNAD